MSDRVQPQAPEPHREPRPRSYSRLQLRLPPSGLVAIVGLLVATRLPAFAPRVAAGFVLVAAAAAALVIDGTWSVAVLHLGADGGRRGRPGARQRGGGLRVAAAAPPDATVGDPTAVRVTITGRRAPLLVRISSVRSADWTRVFAPGQVGLATIPERRGRFSIVELRISHSAPLGLVGAVRTMSVPLTTPILVGPRATPVDGSALLAEVVDLDTTSGGGAQAGGDLVRGARPYMPGDELRRVHWPLTARTGEVMVREFDAERRPAVVVVADLGPAPGPAAEQAASLAAGVVGTFLRRGLTVLLVTREETGQQSAEVTNTIELGRRLAVAETGEGPRLDGMAGGVDHLLVIGPDGWRWERPT